ncbi:MAG TPA: tetratricopeptide repeat protein [Polyangia bacterium]|jgi:tetratricopeptide (TPR) repeat protein
MYRDAPLTGAACYKHASAPQAAQCERCGRALCDPCIVYDLSSPHCIDCARTARRRRSIAAAAKIGGVLAAVAGGIFFVATRPHAIDYGDKGPHIVLLHNKVGNERCERRATLEYDEALLSAGDPRGALADTGAFFAKCGDWYRLRWVTYAAHEALGEHRAAVDEANQLIHHDPMDHDYRWWRALAYEEMGRIDDAIDDYRYALTLEPELDRIPFNLSNLLEQKGQFCAAREPILQFVHSHRQFEHAPNVVDRLTRLRILGHCAD